MKFCQRQLALAVEFKQLGLPWEPAVGNYVYDVTGAVKPTSPFQEGVYFLLNYDCFMDRVGGVEQFKEIMAWLPTWSDAREILAKLGVPDEEVRDALLKATAFERKAELLTLYELIAKTLTSVSSG